MLADREWRFIAEQTRPGPVQMALEEAAAETAAAGGPRTVRVYQWEPSTLSLGYRQDPGTVDWDYCREHGIDVTRRQTGGGGIYHDTTGDISYSIVAPESELPGDLLECYELLCEPVLDAFERMGVDAGFATAELDAVYQPACYLRAIHPAHDILAADRKISGNAQYRQRDAVIQHGSLSCELRPEPHLGSFETDVGKDAYRDRVTSIREQAGVPRARAVEAVETALQEWADATPGGWTDAELDRAREIAREKYDTTAWTRRRETAD